MNKEDRSFNENLREPGVSRRSMHVYRAENKEELILCNRVLVTAICDLMHRFSDVKLKESVHNQPPEGYCAQEDVFNCRQRRCGRSGMCTPRSSPNLASLRPVGSPRISIAPRG